MTTIITKNGSGAPTAGQLSEGELAVDLTNKELYTKSGTTVIKIGSQGGSTGTFTDLTATSSFTSPGIDDNATSTAITIDASENVGIGTVNPSTKLHIIDINPVVKMQSNGASTVNAFSMIGRALDQSAQYNTIKQVSTSGGSLGTLAFCNGPSDTERMRIDASGNVGIGTTTAGQFAGGAVGLTVDSGGAYSGIAVTDGTTTGSLVQGYSTTYLYNQANGNLLLGTNNTERMRISSAGNVGIGTGATVLAPLHVDGSSSTGVAGYLRLQNNNGNTGYTGVYFSADPTYAKQAIYAQRQYPNGGGSLIFAVDSSTDAAEVAISDEKMRIDNAGNLLVGTTTPVGSGAAGVTVTNVSNVIGQVTIAKTYSGTTSAMKFYYGSTQVGRIDYTDTSTIYVTSSDERLKENVTDAPAGNIDSLKVRSFDWKADGEHQEYGFIAQELETVAPYAVSKGETEDDMWGVDYSKLVPMLVKEIQDLKAEVAALKGA